MKQSFTLTAIFPIPKVTVLPLTDCIDSHRAFHAAGNDNPQLTEQSIIRLDLRFTAPASLINNEPFPSALTQAQRFMRREISEKYPGAGEIKWRVNPAGSGHKTTSAA